MRRDYTSHSCEDGHNFFEVMEYGVTSHYRCTACGVKVSEEVMELIIAESEKEEDEYEEDDIVDDDDMC
jgi:hypothetical protein